MSEPEMRAQMNGLVTDPSRILAGESGFVALDNAHCGRPGLVTPRGGFAARYMDESVAAVMPITTYAREWNDRVWYVATDGTNSIATTDGGTVLELDGDEEHLRAEPFADRQCWTFEKALRMLDAVEPLSTSLTRLPGSPRAPALRLTLVNPVLSLAGALPGDTALAYRAVVVRHITTDQGERIIVGAPCDRVVVWNTNGAGLISRSVQINIDDCSAFDSNDELQIYRTPQPSTWTASPGTDPGDEMQLIHTERFSGATFQWTDYLVADSWAGPSLYTNDTQGGIIQANYRMRLAQDVAFYGQMAFYAQGSRGHEKVVELASIAHADRAGNTFDFSNTLYSFTATCTAATGNATINTLNPTVASMEANGTLQLGQLINIAGSDPETASVIYGEVVSYDTVGNTITLSNPATVTGAAQAIIIWDWVGMETSGTIVSRIYAMPNATTTRTYGATSGVFYYPTAANDATLLGSMGGFDMERAWCAKYSSTTYTGRYARLYTAASSEYPYTNRTALWFGWDDSLDDVGDTDYAAAYTQFAVISSKPLAFSEQLGVMYADGFARSEQSGGVATLTWSRLQQPESVPLLQTMTLGDAGARIQRIVATTDSLWVFKDDGLWRIYGSTPDGLVTQPADPTFRMPAQTQGAASPVDTSAWVRKLGDTVYAWTQKGIWAVDAGGVRRVDDAIRSEIAALTPSYRLDNTPGRPFASSSIERSIVVFGAQRVNATIAPFGFCYCLHTETGVWSTWSTTLTDVDAGESDESFFCGSGDSNLGNMWLGSRNGYTRYDDDAAQYSANTSNSASHFCDTLVTSGAEMETNVSDVDGLVITTADALIEGAIISNSDEEFLVVSVDGTDATLDRTGAEVGLCTTVSLPIVQTITYAATTAPGPFVYKRFNRLYCHFQNIRGGISFKHRCRVRSYTTESEWATEHYPDTEVPETLPTAQGLTADREFDVMRDIPTDQVQGTGLEVTLRIGQAEVYSELDAFVILAESVGTTIGGKS